MRYLISLFLLGFASHTWAECTLPADASAVKKSMASVLESLRDQQKTRTQKTALLKTTSYQLECQLDLLNQEPAESEKINYADARRWALVDAQGLISTVIGSACNQDHFQFETQSRGAGHEEAPPAKEPTDWEKAYCSGPAQ